MGVEIREYRLSDHDAVVELSLRAWDPVFASVETLLGEPLAGLLHGADWREHQAHEVSETLQDATTHIWVAERQHEISGFVAAKIADGLRAIGQITMLAVDPPGQRRGTGRALTEHATAWLASIGMRVAVIGTGGDPGHSPARDLYEAAGYNPFPVVQYYKAL